MSKTGIVSPTHYESYGMNWLHSFFAGGLTTCGLLNVGGPEKVMHPVIGEREYGLHGRISNAAAEQVSLFEDYENGVYKMKVSGLVKEGILHGESLTLRREITTEFGKSEFTIRDTVTNRAATPQDIMLLYPLWKGKEYKSMEIRMLSGKKSKEYIWVEFLGSLVLDDDGKPYMSIGVIRNINESKQKTLLWKKKAERDSDYESNCKVFRSNN